MGSKGAQFGWQGELSVSGGSHRDIIRISPRGWAARAYLARANSCRPAIETKDKPLDNLQRVAETDFLPADFYGAGNSPIRQPPRPAGQAPTRYPKPPAHFSRHTKSAVACFACMTQQKKEFLSAGIRSSQARPITHLWERGWRRRGYSTRSPGPWTHRRYSGS